jgi:hypothetical protein
MVELCSKKFLLLNFSNFEEGSEYIAQSRHVYTCKRARKRRERRSGEGHKGVLDSEGGGSGVGLITLTNLSPSVNTSG